MVIVPALPKPLVEKAEMLQAIKEQSSLLVAFARRCAFGFLPFPFPFVVVFVPVVKMPVARK